MSRIFHRRNKIPGMSPPLIWYEHKAINGQEPPEYSLADLAGDLLAWQLQDLETTRVVSHNLTQSHADYYLVSKVHAGIKY